MGITFRLKSAFSRPDMFASVMLLRIGYTVVWTRQEV